MGIPKYRRWLEERFPSAFRSCDCISADHVYVDLNSLMHEVGRLAANPGDFLQKLRHKLDQLFAVVRPVQSVFIAVDGPAAWAKVTEQRKRRRNTVRSDERSSSNRGRSGQGRGRGRGRGRWRGRRGRHRDGTNAFSRNLLTPGLPFMDELTLALERWCNDWMQPGGCLADCSTSLVSGASVAGEGEHKMLAQMLANGARTTANTPGHKADPCEHVFVSGDADLFLLSLVQALCRRVNVVADVRCASSHGRKKGCLTIWSTEALSDAICGELLRADGHRAIAPRAKGLGGATPISREEQGLRRDFCLISLFSGDDYLPALACGISPKLIYEIYLEQRRKPEFHNETLIRSVPTGRPASHLPGGWAFSAGDLGEAFGAEDPSRFEYHIPSLVELMTTIEEQTRHQSQKPDRSGSGSGPVRAADEETEATDGAFAVQGYLTGLLWVLELYHHGHCLDYGYIFRKTQWMHGAQPRMILQHAPQLAALQTQSMLPVASENSASENSLVAPRSDLPPLCPLACAIAVLPVDFAHQQLVEIAGMHPLAPLFDSSHPVLGKLVSLERCCECQRLKGLLAEANRRVQAARIEMTQVTAPTPMTSIANAGCASASAQPVRFAFNRPPLDATKASSSVIPVQRVPTQQEFETLKAESLAAGALLAEHTKAEHPRAEVEWLEPSALDDAVKCAWSKHTNRFIEAGSGDSGTVPRGLSFARTVRIVKPRIGLHRRRDVEEACSDHKRARYGDAATSRPTRNNWGTNPESSGASTVASVDALCPSLHGGTSQSLPDQRQTGLMESEQIDLLQQQQQIEAAILRLTPEQVARLPDEHSAVYWHLKRERCGGQ